MDAGGRAPAFSYLKWLFADARGCYSWVSKTVGRGFESLRPCHLSLIFVR
jgi:hypothetical protein